MKSRLSSADGENATCSGYCRNVSWHLLWHFKVGIPARTGEYSVRGRKISSFFEDVIGRLRNRGGRGRRFSAWILRKKSGLVKNNGLKIGQFVVQEMRTGYIPENYTEDTKLKEKAAQEAGL